MKAVTSLFLLFCAVSFTTAVILNDESMSPRKSHGACSDERLRKLMHQGMSDSASESKKGVASTVSEAVGGSWAVVCAECNFSYIAHSTEYCVHSRFGVTCLMYRD